MSQAPAPILKWVGGKRQLLAQLKPLFPTDYTAYCEPFLGGGAVLFDLAPASAVVNDINPALIETYLQIKTNLPEVLGHLAGLRNTAEDFYRIRAWDRPPSDLGALPAAKRAARVLYLNKTCYNGLFRVNAAGEFNAPFGRYKNPNIVNEAGLRAVHEYLNRNSVEFLCGDYRRALAGLPRGAFVYLDPPYAPVSATANFTGYSPGGFTSEQQEQLRDACDELDQRGIKFALSNSDSPLIRELYTGQRSYGLSVVSANRSVNSVASKRGPVSEVLIRNY